MVFHFFCFFFHSFCCRGNLHLMWNWVIPQLDLLLWFHWDVHVLLRPLADLRVRDPPLWPVSLSNQSTQLQGAVLEQSIICSSPLLSPADTFPPCHFALQGRRDGSADCHHHHVFDVSIWGSEPLASSGNGLLHF